MSSFECRLDVTISVTFFTPSFSLLFDTRCYFFHIRGLIPLLVFYFRVEEKFAGGKFREIPCAVDIYFAGGKFRAQSKFANIAKMSSTRKIRVIQNTDDSGSPSNFTTPR